MKKSALLLVLFMLCTLLGACSPTENTTTGSSATTTASASGTTTTTEGTSSLVTPAGELPIVTEPVSINIAMPIRATVDDINSNRLTTWIQEMTGITLEFTELSPTDLETQINMIMNSGDLPDVFWSYNFPYDALQSHIDAGLILPLNDYIDQYASAEGYKRFVNEFPVDNVEAYVTINDLIYAVPSGGCMVTNIYGSFGIRIQNEFLSSLNMDMPRTLDSYLNYLIAVRDEDANGNGDSTDEVPLTSYVGLSHNIYRAIGNAFQYTDASTYLKVNNGIVSFVAKNDAFKQTAEYIKMLVDENLLDPAGFTQDAASLQARSLDATIMGSFAVGNSSSMVDTSSPQYLGLIFMPPLEGPAGYRATPMNMPRVNRCMVITTSCKTPDVAFRLCDFMLTEEAGTACRIGHEGVEWKVAAQGELGRNGEQAKYKLLKPQEWIQPKTDAIWGIENINFGNTMNFVAEEPNSPISVQVKSLLEGDALNFNTGEQLPELLMSIEDAAEYNDIKTLIVNYINENLALFALGDRSMSEWDVFINEFKAMGSDRYVELAQAAYDNLTD